MALDPKQVRAIVLMSSGSTHGETAREVGVDPATLYRWRHNDAEFAAELAKSLDGQIEEARTVMRGAAARAVSRILYLMEDNGAPHAVQLKAATEMLDRIGVLAAKQDIDRECTPDELEKAMVAARKIVASE